VTLNFDPLTFKVCYMIKHCTEFLRNRTIRDAVYRANQKTIPSTFVDFQQCVQIF